VEYVATYNTVSKHGVGIVNLSREVSAHGLKTVLSCTCPDNYYIKIDTAYGDMKDEFVLAQSSIQFPT